MTKEEILQKLKTDLELRGRSHHTIKEYLERVKVFQDYFNKPADQMSEFEISNFLHHLLTEKKLRGGSVNTYNSAIRFAYGVTLGRNLNYKKVPRAKQSKFGACPKSLPKMKSAKLSTAPVA